MVSLLFLEFNQVKIEPVFRINNTKTKFLPSLTIVQISSYVESKVQLNVYYYASSSWNKYNPNPIFIIFFYAQIKYNVVYSRQI